MPTQYQEYGLHCLNFSLLKMPYSTYMQEGKPLLTSDVPPIKKAVSSLFGLSFSEDFQPINNSKTASRKYRSCSSYRGLINVYYDGFGNNADSVHVEIKGSAFDSTELNWTESDITRIVDYALTEQCNICEVHIYVDDKPCLLNFGKLLELVINHAVSSHCRAVVFNGKSKGDARSFAYGSRPKRYSFYESGRHRYVGDSAEYKGISEDFLDYVRVEAQLSGRYAHEALARFRMGEGLGSIALSYIGDAVEFKTPGTDSNPHRWKILPAWGAFTAGSGTIPPKPKRKPPELAGKLNYLQRKIDEISLQFGVAPIEAFLKSQLEMFQEVIPVF